MHWVFQSRDSDRAWVKISRINSRPKHNMHGHSWVSKSWKWFLVGVRTSPKGYIFNHARSQVLVPGYIRIYCTQETAICEYQRIIMSYYDEYNVWHSSAACTKALCLILYYFMRLQFMTSGLSRSLTTIAFIMISHKTVKRVRAGSMSH